REIKIVERDNARVRQRGERGVEGAQGGDLMLGHCSVGSGQVRGFGDERRDAGEEWVMLCVERIVGAAGVVVAERGVDGYARQGGPERVEQIVDGLDREADIGGSSRAGKERLVLAIELVREKVAGEDDEARRRGCLPELSKRGLPKRFG